MPEPDPAAPGPETLSSHDEAALTARLRADLLAADYTVDGLQALLGDSAAAALRRDHFAAVRWRLDRIEPSPAAVLVRTFLLGDEVRAAELEAALPGCGVAGATRLGLIRRSGEGASALLELRPHAEADGPDWWLVADLGEQVTGGPIDTDYVLGVGQASLTLATLTPRPAAARALDLGTGCGVQALHLSRHCESVTMTDLSERACRLARLSLAISGVSADVRGGDLFEPVADEEFDLVVTNPPFVITPRTADVPTFTYRDGGRPGDQLTSTLIEQAGRHLRPGGIFVALGNWEVPAEAGEPSRSWSARVTDWVSSATDRDGKPLDAWVIQRELLDPAEYAGMWVRDGGAEAAGRERLVRAWLDDFDRRGVTAIGLGAILLRRPGLGTRPFRRIEHRPEPVAAGLGAHLQACIAAHDAAAGPVADLRLRTADDVVERRDHLPGEVEPDRIHLVQATGFGRIIEVDTATAAFVGACDGELTVGQLAGALAVLLEQPLDDLLTQLSDQAQELILDGVLAPA